MKPLCVLCPACANYGGRRDSERRQGFPRVCAAGLVLGPTTFQCDSFVPIWPIPVPQRSNPSP